MSYSLFFKYLIIVDLLVISIGFVIRAVAGCLAVDVFISPWLIICAFLLALFLALGKRRHELILLGDEAKNHRKILEEYSTGMLDQMISITTGSLIIAYSMYTFLADNYYMMLTIPFAIYGIFRYLFLIHARDVGGEPEMLFKDRGMLVCMVLWGVVVGGGALFGCLVCKRWLRMGQLWDYKIIQIKKFLNYIYQLDEKKILFYIFGISLVIRLLFIIIFPIKPHSDAANYNNLAIGLIEGTGYAGGIGSYLPPGQSFFLAAIYFIFGYNPQIACIIQALISSLTCIIIYYIGKSILNKKIGIISGLIAALYPTLIVFSGLLFSETLFIFLFSLLTLSLLRIYEERSAKNILIAGVSLGLATLVRPAIIGLLPFILIWMLLSSPDIKKNLIKFTVIILIAVVIISPWIIRNYNVHNEFVLVSTNGGVNFWIGNNPEATGTYGSCDWPNVPNSPFLETTDEIKRDRLGYVERLTP